jgi:hypothetical protein
MTFRILHGKQKYVVKVCYIIIIHEIHKSAARYSGFICFYPDRGRTYVQCVRLTPPEGAIIGITTVITISSVVCSRK